MQYCSECGSKISEGANFCSSCGTAVASAAILTKKPQERIDNSKPLFRMRPVFIPSLSMLSTLPLTIFFTIWGAGFFGGFGMFGLEALGIDLPTGTTFVFFGMVFLFGIPILTYISQGRTYAQTEYKFYSDRLEYAEGWWAAEKKSIKYDKIQEASLRQGIFQKKYGLGTIVLSTPATGLQNGRARSGIRISDIENPERVYMKLKELIDI